MVYVCEAMLVQFILGDDIQVCCPLWAWKSRYKYLKHLSLKFQKTLSTVNVLLSLDNRQFSWLGEI